MDFLTVVASMFVVLFSLFLIPLGIHLAQGWSKVGGSVLLVAGAALLLLDLCNLYNVMSPLR